MRMCLQKLMQLQNHWLKVFQCFWKKQNPNGAYAAVIPKWVTAFLNKEDVFINGDGETSRTFVISITLYK